MATQSQKSNKPLFFRDMMQGQHVDPEEAVQIHQDLQAKQSVAIHWGTFALAYEVRGYSYLDWTNLLSVHYVAGVSR